MTFEDMRVAMGVILVVGGLTMLAIGAYGMYLYSIVEKNK